MRVTLSWLVVTASFTVVKAAFGDYADPTFSCPAITTCRRVCVAKISDCPLEMQCNGTKILCADGTCAEKCVSAETPCRYSCAPFACAKNVIDYYDKCQEAYKPYYDFEAKCGAAELAKATHLWTFTEPAFVVLYAWITSVTVIIIVWCFYNQRWDPVPGSTQALQVDSINAQRQGEVNEGWQTGYKMHPVGLFLHFLTLVTLWGFQILLAWLTIQYYIQQGAINGKNFRQQFNDEQQCLKAFEIVWSTFFDLFFSFVYDFMLVQHLLCRFFCLFLLS